MKKMKLLFVDDEEKILNSIDRILNSKKNVWDLYYSSSGEDALNKCEEISIDLIVTDAHMPNMDGIELLKVLQKNELTKYIPTIMITGQPESKIIKKALEAGAVEFLPKPLIAEEFILRLSNILKLKKLNDELIKKNQLLESLSYTDPLTGLFNRRGLISNIEEKISVYKRYHRPFSILMFDVDNFKSYNDKFGHSVGDELLIKVSDVLKDTLRKTDFICRYGGDEFLILMPETNLIGADQFIERIVNHIHSIPIKNQRISISGGASEYKGQNLDDFIKIVDSLLYEAKTSGKNKIIY